MVTFHVQVSSVSVRDNTRGHQDTPVGVAVIYLLESVTYPPEYLLVAWQCNARVVRGRSSVSYSIAFSWSTTAVLGSPLNLA